MCLDFRRVVIFVVVCIYQRWLKCCCFFLELKSLCYKVFFYHFVLKLLNSFENRITTFIYSCSLFSSALSKNLFYYCVQINWNCCPVVLYSRSLALVLFPTLSYLYVSAECTLTKRPISVATMNADSWFDWI